MVGRGQTEPGLPCPQCKKASGRHKAQNLVRKDRLEGVGTKDDASQNSFCIFGSQDLYGTLERCGCSQEKGHQY